MVAKKNRKREETTNTSKQTNRLIEKPCEHDKDKTPVRQKRTLHRSEKKKTGGRGEEIRQGRKKRGGGLSHSQFCSIC